MFTSDNTILVIIDVQGKLAHLMFEKESLFQNLQILIKGVKILGLPILWTEQTPEKIGPTIPEIAQILSPKRPISKISFSCCQNEMFMQEFKALNRKQILIAGIETHICIYQTTVDLINLGHKVQVVVDAVSSRTVKNKRVGLNRIKDTGASLTSVETALFELLKVAEGKEFKEILKLIK